MTSVSVEVNRWYDSLKSQKLNQNDQSAANWSRYKNDLQVTKSLLSLLPKKLTHNVMVPIGPKALMPGKIVHTNEFLVNLGETWFVKRTGHQTEEICNRRIKNCDEMLQKLEKEKELILSKTTLPVEQDAFGSDSRPEIIEYVTEEENEEWRKQHRIREKEYHQKLAELRNKEKKQINTEEDLWKHLDELELQEELEDELNRLNSDFNSSSDESENEVSENKDIANINQLNTSDFNNSKSVENNSANNSSTNSNSKKIKAKERRVSFACDLDLSNEEPLKLIISHSNIECSPRNQDESCINSPSDIYDRYIKSFNTTRAPVLKSVGNPNREKELENVEKQKKFDSNESENEDETYAETMMPATNSIRFNDVVERNPFTLGNSQVIESKTKKLSKFKLSRAKPAD